MIKKTLYFGNPAYLSLANGQLVIKLPEVEKQSNLPTVLKNSSITTLPIEDVGIIVLDNRQITLTHGLVTALMANCTVIISCDEPGGYSPSKKAVMAANRQKKDRKSGLSHRHAYFQVHSIYACVCRSG